MKSLATIFILTVLFIPTFSQVNDTTSRLFQRYNELQKADSLIFKTSDNRSLGLRPSPWVVNFQDNKKSVLKSALPEFYDLRQTNYVSPVKNQGNYGTCWTFATMAAIESNLLRSKGLLYDFSEKNLATCHGFELDPDDGGNASMASAYISRIDGPVTESEDPYSGMSANADCIDLGTTNTVIANLRFLPPVIDIIKQAVIDNGALYTSMCWIDSAYNDTDKTYYSTSTDCRSGHAVAIVGWENNKTTEGGKGAWIAKNSWGTGWGDKGYFYVSYNDSKFAKEEIAFFQPAGAGDEPDTLLYYDNLGALSSIGYSTDTAYALVKYSVPKNFKTISKIGTYISSSNSILEIAVYNSFLNNKLSGLITETKNIRCSYPGYYSFDNYAEVDSVFYIRIKYMTPGYNYPVPIEKKITGYAEPAIETGKCWISPDGLSWTGVGANIALKKYDLCIRTYAKNGKTSTGTNISSSDIEPEKPSVFPNPASSIINITGKDLTRIELFNLQGEALFLYLNAPKDTTCHINVSDYEPGLYLLKIKNTNVLTVHKIIIN